MKHRKFKRRYRAKGKTSISVSAQAHEALRAVAESQNKSVRQVVEEWVGEAAAEVVS